MSNSAFNTGFPGQAALRVAVWSPYKPLEQELCRLLRASGQGVVAHPYDDVQKDAGGRDPGTDLLVVDIDPSTNGFVSLIRQIRSASPGMKVIALSTHREWSLVTSAFEAGAIGYVLKDCAFEDLPESLRAAARNERYVSPAIESGRRRLGAS